MTEEQSKKLDKIYNIVTGDEELVDASIINPDTVVDLYGNYISESNYTITNKQGRYAIIILSVWGSSPDKSNYAVLTNIKGGVIKKQIWRKVLTDGIYVSATLIYITSNVCVLNGLNFFAIMLL